MAPILMYELIFPQAHLTFNKCKQRMYVYVLKKSLFCHILLIYQCTFEKIPLLQMCF
jgi:hypothetical protein